VPEGDPLKTEMLDGLVERAERPLGGARTVVAAAGRDVERGLDRGRLVCGRCTRQGSGGHKNKTRNGNASWDYAFLLSRL